MCEMYIFFFLFWLLVTLSVFPSRIILFPETNEIHISKEAI